MASHQIDEARRLMLQPALVDAITNSGVDVVFPSIGTQRITTQVLKHLPDAILPLLAEHVEAQFGPAPHKIAKEQAIAVASLTAPVAVAAPLVAPVPPVPAGPAAVDMKEYHFVAPSDVPAPAPSAQPSPRQLSLAVGAAGSAEGSTVEICGSFDGWQARNRMTLDRSVNKFLFTLPESMQLQPGAKYRYKFIVDGAWRVAHEPGHAPTDFEDGGNENHVLVL